MAEPVVSSTSTGGWGGEWRSALWDEKWSSAPTGVVYAIPSSLVDGSYTTSTVISYPTPPIPRWWEVRWQCQYECPT